jgi:HrpA-like RNA helicase
MCLFGLEALDRAGRITLLGRTMSQFPLLPPYSRALLASKDHSCTQEVINILSILSASSKVFVDSASDQREAMAEARLKFRHSSGDHMTLLNVLRAYNDIVSASSELTNSNVNKDIRDWCNKNFVNERALKESKDITNQLSGLCSKLGINPRASAGDDADPVLRSLLAGFFNNTALIQPDGTYRQVLGATVRRRRSFFCDGISLSTHVSICSCSPSESIRHHQCLAERSQL